MKNFFPKLKAFVVANKIISVVVALMLIIGGYKAITSNGPTQTRYVMANATTGTIVNDISATGQVSSFNQVNLQPKVAGTIIYVGVTNGQQVKAGTLIAELDSTDAQKTVRNAQASLESSKLSLQKLQEATDPATLLSAQGAVTQANSDLVSAYNDGFTSVSSAYIDLPNVMSGLNSILYNNDVSGGSQLNESYYADIGQGQSYGDDANAKYQTALASYNTSLLAYKNSSRSSDPATTLALINQTYNTTLAVADAVKSASTLIQYYQDQLTQRNLTPLAKSTTALSNLSTYTTQLNSHISGLLSNINTINVDNASIPEKQAALTKLQNGADPLDLQSSQLNVQQAQNALLDAQQSLTNYFVYAPLDGIIGNLTAQKGNTASSGSALATLVTNQQLADVSLNEVDVAKVNVGQKVTLTFDAIPNLSIAGSVAEINPIGTVSQGVVNYDVKIAFATEDARVKSGMSVSAAIITAVDQDVVTVPSSAVKTQAGSSYVLMFNPPIVVAPADITSGTASAVAPVQIPVTIGISDGISTEITSGLKEGDQVVSKTIVSATSTKSTTTAPSLLSSVGGGARAGGGGNAVFSGGARPATPATTTTKGN